MEDTVYIEVKETELQNDVISEIKEVRKNLEDNFDKLLKVYDKYNSFRELDFMLQKVEEAILWSHRVIALESEAIEEENISLDCEKSNCCKKREDCNKIGEDFNIDSKKFLNDLKEFLKNFSR